MELTSNEDDALIVIVEFDILDVAAVEELRQFLQCGLVRAEVFLEDTDNVILAQTAAVGGIFDSLPRDVLAGVVELVLDDNKVAFLV